MICSCATRVRDENTGTFNEVPKVWPIRCRPEQCVIIGWVFFCRLLCDTGCRNRTYQPHKYLVMSVGGPYSQNIFTICLCQKKEQKAQFTMGQFSNVLSAISFSSSGSWSRTDSNGGSIKIHEACFSFKHFFIAYAWTFYEDYTVNNKKDIFAM